MNAQIDRMLGMLGSEHSGEVVNAASAIRLALKKQGLSFHQVRLVERGASGSMPTQYEVDVLHRQLADKDAQIAELRSLVSDLFGQLRILHAHPASNDREFSSRAEPAPFETYPTEVTWKEFKARCKDVVGCRFGWRGRIVRRLDISRQCLADFEAGAPIPRSMIAKLWAL